MGERFSTRRGFVPENAEITVREDAPDDLRYAVVEIAYGLERSPSWLRDIVCRVLRARPDRNNWSEFPNVDDEVRNQIDSCEWFRVYDIIEAIHEQIGRENTERMDATGRFIP